MEELFENWEASPSQPDMDNELKKIRRNLRRRNWKTILTSVVLVIAILFAAVRYGIPALESRYWDPTVCTYLDDVTDLELTMATYTELFGHGRHFGTVGIQKQGFAAYALDTIFLDWKNMHNLTDVTYRSTVLDRGQMDIPFNFWSDTERGFIIRTLSEFEDYIQGRNEQTKALLSTLPDYIQILAGITFSEDQTMYQLCELKRTNMDTTRFLWAVLRNDPEAEYFGRCGVDLTFHHNERYSPSFWRNSDYPHLFFDTDWSGTYLEQHVTSMLQFSADQFHAGTGFSPGGEDGTFYRATLDYLEENGIYSYGAYVIATPSALLEMLEDGTAAHIELIDAQIGLP